MQQFMRRQCGVVLQDSQLFAGDILSNVVGSGGYTADDAWAAIELVGLDEEVPAMPMGMFTVIAEGFVGPFTEQVRVIGEAAQPHALPYRTDMTVLDAMIEVGGLTRYAAGNDSVIVRTAANGKQTTYSVHLDSLIRDGEVSSNVALQPGDILIIPQRLF